MQSDELIVVGLGELLWDVFPDGKRPGGAPANVAFQAQQLNCRGVVATRVGADADGDELVAFLQAKGLHTTAIQRDPDHPTGRVTVTLSSEGHPQYVIHENAAWDFLRMTYSLAAQMRQAAAVCFGTLAQRNETSRETIYTALAMTRPECLRVYDVNLRQKFYNREWIDASLQRAAVVKLNDEEVKIVGSLLGLDTREEEFSKQVIERWGVRTVCVTRGAKGCLAVSANEVHDVPGRPVKVADSVGAGDAFAAGLIYSQLKSWPLGLSAEFANRLGGLVASRPGAMPELRVEFQQLIAQYEN